MRRSLYSYPCGGYPKFTTAPTNGQLLEKAQEKRGDARVVQHSSGARKAGNRKLEARFLQKNGGNLDGDQLGFLPFQGGRWVRYQQSKLAK